MDIFPTIVDILKIPEDVLLEPVDGISIKPLLQNRKVKIRKKPIQFRYQGKGALVDNNLKLVASDIEKGIYELYNLQLDKTESEDISMQMPDKSEELKANFIEWNNTVEKSIAGLDYPEKEVDKNEPERHFWMDDPKYGEFKKVHGNRPEYSGEYREMNKDEKSCR